MWDFLRVFQLGAMVFLSGGCGVIAIMALLTRTLTKSRRRAMVSMALSAMFLLIFDRVAYLYRGNMTDLGYYMVRISNFLVFFLLLLLIHTFTVYLLDLYRSTEFLSHAPLLLVICKLIFYIGVIVLIISQFTGFYYTFDSSNHYQRASGYTLCFIIPLIIAFLQFLSILRIRQRLQKNIFLPLVLFTILPIIVSFLQIIVYGLSLTNLTIVCMVIVLYVFEIVNLGKAIVRANKREIELLKEEQQKIQTIFEQTAEALASAIDAKDQYTHGHSNRVAEYSLMIAKEIGLNITMCNEIYFSALLHDVGKIGIPDTIINKEGRLTAGEYLAIQQHPVIGKRILSSISESSYLRDGACYHHERYDGKGYPDGLIGEDIPEVARIIAVADAYDAMTSNRSYRSALSQKKVRDELIKGLGTQFDPIFADVMIRLVDADTDFKMREHANLIKKAL